MKIKDIKEVIDFLDKDGMDPVKNAIVFLHKNCPDDIGLKGDFLCPYDGNCFECWGKCLSLEENKDKLENEI